MIKISNEDSQSVDARKGGNSANYYLNLYEACLLLVKGNSMANTGVSGALKKRLERSSASAT